MIKLCMFQGTDRQNIIASLQLRLLKRHIKDVE